jgi:hypothetical protein
MSFNLCIVVMGTSVVTMVISGFCSNEIQSHNLLKLKRVRLEKADLETH